VHIPFKLRFLRSSGCALGFVVALLTGQVVQHVAPQTADHWTSISSTSVHNLLHKPVFAMVTSVIWVVDGSVALWLVPGAAALIVAQMTVGWKRTLAVVFGAHVVATLITEGGVLLLVTLHHLPTSDLDIIDVGPSYVVVAALTYALFRFPVGLRVLLPIILVPTIASGIINARSWDLADAGHILVVVLVSSLCVLERHRLGMKLQLHVPNVFVRNPVAD
jgi:hypothetical protein